MPTFTMELWRVDELYKGAIGLDSYPIFNEQYRADLNKKIKDHYHNREIGHETAGMFIFALRRRMNEIMPYYNELYKSQILEFDPLVTMDVLTTNEGTSDTTTSASGTNTSVTNSNSGSRAVTSEVPQTMLAGNEDYATSAVDTNGASLAEGTTNESNSGEAKENTANTSHSKGYQGNPSLLIQEYRRTLLNIDMLIIDELSDLFMGVWDNGDDYLHPMYPFTPLPNI